MTEAWGFDKSEVFRFFTPGAGTAQYYSLTDEQLSRRPRKPEVDPGVLPFMREFIADVLAGDETRAALRPMTSMGHVEVEVPRTALARCGADAGSATTQVGMSGRESAGYFDFRPEPLISRNGGPQSTVVDTMTPRASVITRRLYASVLALLSAAGVTVALGIVVVFLHDQAVTTEDRRCFVRLAESIRSDVTAELQRNEHVHRATFAHELARIRLLSPTRVVQEFGPLFANLDATQRARYLELTAKANVELSDSEMEVLVALDETAYQTKPAQGDWMPEAARCHLELKSATSNDGVLGNPDWRSNRTWYEQPPDRAAILAASALLPALALFSIGRWVRWLLRP